MTAPQKATQTETQTPPSGAEKDHIPAEELLPRAAAKPRGKMLWVIGVVLLAAYFLMDKENRVEIPVTFALIQAQSLPQDKQMAFAGLQSQLSFDLTLAVGYGIEDILNSSAVFTEKSVRATFQFTGPLKEADKKLIVTLTDQDSELWQYDYGNIEDHAYSGLYTSLSATLKSLLDLNGKAQAEKPYNANPFAEMSADDFNAYIQGLGAFSLGRYQQAIKDWGRFTGGYDRPVLLNWYMGMAHAALNEQEQARIYYAFAVSGYPKLAKNLPDWVLGLKS